MDTCKPKYTPTNTDDTPDNTDTDSSDSPTDSASDSKYYLGSTK